MTENEWQTCTDPTPMLHFLRGRVNERKVRLFACACCRRIWYHLVHYGEWQPVLVAEQFADGLVGKPALRTAHINAKSPASKIVTARRIPLSEIVNSTNIAYGLHQGKQEGWKSSILHCLFGNPFRPLAFDPVWLTPTVTSLATAAYEERALPAGELESARLAVLADALEDAGCDNGDILNHLRRQGPHVRGCQVIDSILGRS